MTRVLFDRCHYLSHPVRGLGVVLGFCGGQRLLWHVTRALVPYEDRRHTWHLYLPRREHRTPPWRWPTSAGFCPSYSTQSNSWETQVTMDSMALLYIGSVNYRTIYMELSKSRYSSVGKGWDSVFFWVAVPSGPRHVKGCGCAGFCPQWSTTCQRLWVCWILSPVVHDMSKAVGVLDSVPSGPPHVKGCGCAGFCPQWSTTCQRLWVCWILSPVVHDMSKAVGVLDSLPSGPRHVKGCGCAGLCPQWSTTCQRLWVCWILSPVVHDMSKAVGVLDSVPSGPRHVKGCGCAGFCPQWSTTCQRLWVCWILSPCSGPCSGPGQKRTVVIPEV